MLELPFSGEQFLQVFERYNAAIWPLQLFAYAGAIAVLVLAVLRSTAAGRAAAALLAAMWMVNGIGYHLAYFREINPAAVAFGALFLAQAALFGWQGGVRGRLQIKLAADARSAAGLLAIAYAMLGYPLLGFALGHVYPAAPAFGVAPCPTTIFTLGMLLLARPAAPALLFAIPLAWTAVGGSAAFALRMPEDLGLVAAGLAAVVFVTLSLIQRNPDEAHA
jgi:hypothetical protein